MKTTLIFYATLFFSVSLFSQKATGEMVGFGCGYAGSLTPAVQEMVQQLKEGDHTSIRKNLYSKEAAHQFLAVVVLEYLAEQDMLTLDQEEHSQISHIKLSENQVSVCSGCTYWDSVSLKELLDTNIRHFITNSAQHWVAATLANL